MRLRGFLGAAVGLTASAVLAGPALAAWSVTGSAAGTGTAATLQAPASATTSGVTASSVTVQWTAPAGGPAPTGYRVERVSPAAVVCASTTALSCTDSGLSAATAYSYNVYALLHSWDGSAVTTSTSTNASDTTAPTVTPVCPAANASYSMRTTGQNATSGSWISTCNERVTVSVTDASGLSSVKISVRAGTTSGKYLESNGNWNSSTEELLTASRGDEPNTWYVTAAENKIAAGTKTVKVYGTDSSPAGNVSITTYTFSITA